MRKELLSCLALAFAACNQASDPNDNPDSPVDPADPTDPDDPPNPQETARDNDELATILSAHLRAEFALQLVSAAIVRNEYALPEGFVYARTLPVDVSVTVSVYSKSVRPPKNTQ